MEGYVFLDVGGTQLKSAAYSPEGERIGGIRVDLSRALEDRETILSNFLSLL